MPDPKIGTNQANDYLKSLQSWKKEIEKATAPDGKGEQIKPIKESLSSTLSESIAQSNETSSSSQISDVVNSTHSQIMSQMNENWQQEAFKKIIQESNTYVERAEVHNELQNANQWFLNKIPKFIYFDRYDIIQSAISVTEFIQRYQTNSNDPQLRITKCLFEHVGLDIEQIRDLDPNDEKQTTEELQRLAADERGIRLSSASDTMTEKFEEWWETESTNSDMISTAQCFVYGFQII